MRKRKHLLALAIALVFALCLTACGDTNGGNGGNGNYGGNGGYSDNNGNNGNGGYSDNNGNNGNGGYSDNNGNNSNGGYSDNNGNNGNGGYSDNNGNNGNGGYSDNNNGGWFNKTENSLSLAFYKLDQNTFHVLVKDDTGKVISRASQISINIKGNSDSESGYISLQNDYCNSNFYFNDSSYYSKTYYDYAVYNDVAFATFSLENFEQYLKPGFEYSIYCYGNDLNGDTYGLGKVELSTLTAQEYSDLRLYELNNFTPANKAHDSWAQQFLYNYYDYYSDNGGSEYGLVNVSISNNGAILVDIDKNDTHEYYALEETKFEQIVYNYGEIVEAIATLPGNNENVMLTMTRDVDTDPYYSLYVSGTSANNYRSRDYTLIPFSSKAEAPSDYNDKDEYGYVEEILKDSSNFLYPTTDNYLIKVYKTNDYYYDYNTSTSTEYPCVEITLYEYDINDIEIGMRKMMLYEDDAVANRMLGYRNQYSNYYTKQGTALCYVETYNYYDSKTSRLNYEFTVYEGMHYAYCSSSYYDVYYIYSSKPFDTRNQYDIETVKTLLAIPQGEHRSTDSKDVSMYTYTSVYTDDGLSFSYSVYNQDYNSHYEPSSNYNTVYRNNVATTIRYEEDYNDNCFVYIDVVTFSKTEAIATRYVYKVENFDNVQISLDNYQTFTPESTTTHSFDMARIKQS